MWSTAMSPDMLKDKKRGDRIAAAEWDSLVRLAHSQGSPPEFGFEDTDVRGGHPVVVPRPRGFPAFTEEDLPPYSVFGLTSGEAEFLDPPRLRIRRSQGADYGSPLLAFTNGLYGVDADNWVMATPVSLWEPVPLKVSGTCKIGHPCGPKIGGWEVSPKGHGLVAVTTVNDDDVQWFMRSTGPISVIGKISSTLPKYVSGTETIGSTEIEIWGRTTDAGAVIAELYDPDSQEQPWAATVYNIGSQDVAAGLIMAVEVMGVGLVAIPPPAGGIREGKLDADLTGPSGTATVSVWEAGVDTTVNVTGVTCWLLGASAKLKSGWKVAFANIAGIERIIASEFCPE